MPHQLYIQVRCLADPSKFFVESSHSLNYLRLVSLTLADLWIFQYVISLSCLSLRTRFSGCAVVFWMDHRHDQDVARGFTAPSMLPFSSDLIE